MRRSKKNPDDTHAGLTTWVEGPDESTWQTFKNPLKSSDLAPLANEQDGYCCYCGRLLETEIFEKRNSRHPSTCGDAKGSEAICIKPTEQDCEHCFLYGASGIILADPINMPDRVQDAHQSIAVLNLNDTFLTKQRELAITTLMKDCELLSDGD